MVESNIELIRWLIYLNVFYLFITQYDQFLPLIINSFQQAGAYLGSSQWFLRPFDYSCVTLSIMGLT